MLINAVTGLAGYGVAKVTSAGGAKAERYVVDKTAAAKKAIQKFACGDAKKVTAQDPIEDVTPDVPDVVEDLTPEVADTPDGVGRTKNSFGSKLQELSDIADNYTLSDDTLNNHIIDRHGSNSTYKDKSHFNDDFDIKGGIDSTLRGESSTIRPNTSGREGYIFEKTFKNPIGTNSKDSDLYTLKVVINESGNVITAFPKK